MWQSHFKEREMRGQTRLKRRPVDVDEILEEGGGDASGIGTAAGHRDGAHRIREESDALLRPVDVDNGTEKGITCLLYTSPSPRDCS